MIRSQRVGDVVSVGRAHRDVARPLAAVGASSSAGGDS
jgi:hypothetical protein